MPKISNTGAGGIKPPGADATENIKQPVSPKEANPIQPSPADYESASPKKVIGDKYAAGDLKTSGDRTKSRLDSKLAPQSKDVPAQPHPGFAPPYVPVGPVVMGDNIGIPGQTSNIPGETTTPSQTKHLSLKGSEFQINDQGNLVITNEKLIEFFKSLKQSTAGGDANISITNLKRPGEE